MKIDLNGSWYLDSSKYTHLPAKIPGSVLSTLLTHQLIDDPFYRENEENVRKCLYEDYTFSRKFTLTPEQLKKKNHLCLDGIDTIAKVFINNQLITEIFDMHTPERILLEPSLLSEENEIRICFQSPYTYIENYEDQGLFATFAVTEEKAPCIRKAHHMFGWDWGPNLADMGIYRDIYIESTTLGYLEDFRHECTFLPDGAVQIDVEINSLLYTKEGTLSVTLSLEEDSTYLIKELPLTEHATVTFLLKNPKRWNPIGYGTPTLYHLDFQLQAKNGETLQYHKRIGIREVVFDHSKDSYGTNFCVYINGNKIFLKGSNYIPEDNILSRITKEHTLRLLKLAKDFQHNVIRVWGGGYYPSEYFYDYCDENGLLVWQDLMFACATYNIHDEHFRSLIIREITSAVKSFRHHASIFVIAGDNECEDGVNGHKKEWMEAYKAMSLDVIVPLIKQLTSTHFLRTSPRSAEIFQHQNDTEHYDTHYWGIWSFKRPLEDYQTIFPRMLSEVGHQSFPLMTTIRQFTPENEWSLTSPTILHHQKRPGCNENILHYIKELYGTPEKFEDLVYLSHLAQGEAIRLCTEHLRRHQDRCNGVIYWQLNDCWPGLTWSSIDYYFGLKALHYFSKHFFAPYLISMEKNDHTLNIFVSNTTNIDTNVKLLCQHLTFDGQILKEKQLSLCSEKAASQNALCLTELDFSHKNSLVYARLEDNAGHLLSENYYLPAKDKEIDYPIPHFKLKSINEFSFEIIADTFAKNVYLQYDDMPDIVFSDNYFNLLKDSPKIVTANTAFSLEKVQITSVNQVTFQ